MKITVEVESLDKIGYTHSVRVPNPDLHMLCLARELSIVAVGTIGKVKVGNGTPAKHNPNVVQVDGLKSITVTDETIEIIGEHNTITIKEAVSKELPKSNKAESQSAKKAKTSFDGDIKLSGVGIEHHGKATARPTKRRKSSKKDT